MTITNTTDTVSFTGDGATAAFAYTFPTKLSSDLVVTYKVTSTGAETVLTETTHYTATVGDSGGTVTTTAVPSGLTHPIPSTATLHVTRVTPKTQATDLALGGAFSPEVLEDAYDKTPSSPSRTSITGRVPCGSLPLRQRPPCCPTR